MLQNASFRSTRFLVELSKNFSFRQWMSDIFEHTHTTHTLLDLVSFGPRSNLDQLIDCPTNKSYAPHISRIEIRVLGRENCGKQHHMQNVYWSSLGNLSNTLYGQKSILLKTSPPYSGSHSARFCEYSIAHKIVRN